MIIPTNPKEAAVRAVMETVRTSIGLAHGLGCAVRDTIALEELNDVLNLASREMRTLLPDMLEVVSRIDHHRDISIRRDAAAQIERLRTLCTKYSPAFKEGRLPRHAMHALFPKGVSDLVCNVDAQWRLVLALVEKFEPDEHQVDVIDRMRGLLRTSFGPVTEAMCDSLEDAPAKAKVDLIREIETRWIELVGAGADPTEAYARLAKSDSMDKDRMRKMKEARNAAGQD